VGGPASDDHDGEQLELTLGPLYVVSGD